MEISEKNGNIILTGADSFSLRQTFDCGQCFRWERIGEETYIGVAMERVLCVSQSGDEVVFHKTSREDFDGIWADYFDLHTDYSEIKKTLSADTVLKEAIAHGGGIRILRQDLWECVVSFIISASNNIPRIKKIIDSFCRNFGEEISYMGKTYYSFPTAEKTASLTREDISIIKAGFRDKYILAAADIFAHGRTDAENLKKLSAPDAKQKLTEIPGVGSKVADCVLLFGLNKTESFPVDVWIKRIVEHCYFDEPQSKEIISDFAKKRFAELGGYAQQYLFYWARENKIGI